jgi:small subunit ribosomal protein S6
MLPHKMLQPFFQKIRALYPKGGETQMRTYETIVILDPDLSDEDNEKALKKIEEVIESQSGKIAFVDHWGKRKLAYRVKKKFKGDYYRFVYYGSGNIIAVLERNLRITEDVYKFLTVKLSDSEIEVEQEKAEKTYTSDTDDNDTSPSSAPEKNEKKDEAEEDDSFEAPESDEEEEGEKKEEED